MTRPSRIILATWTMLAGALGIGALVARLRSSGGASDDDSVSLVSIFQEATRRSTASTFRHGSVVSMFGSSHLDLRRARMSVEGARLRVLTLFGDTEITVPDSWRARITGPTLAGSSRLNHRSPMHGIGPVLTIRAQTLFGNLEVSGRPVLLAATES